jgi:hypothetical protein
MTDHELVAATNPPQPLADAFLSQSESDVEALLDLLFCCHQLVDDPEQEDSKWFNVDSAWLVRKQYMEGQVHPALMAIAPTWDDAMRITLEWLKTWPHDCGEYDYWGYGRDEMDDVTAIAFLREMMTTRVPAMP